MFVLIINKNSTSFIFQDKHGVLFFFCLAINMPCAKETELRTQILAGKLMQSKEKNSAICNFEVRTASKKKY